MDLVREPGNGMQNSQAEEKPWDRQPGESAKAYRAFGLYRDSRPIVRSNLLRACCSVRARIFEGGRNDGIGPAASEHTTFI
jgi:hypothetical protein